MYDDVTYTRRILVYDNNCSSGFSDDYCLYFTDDQDTFIIPAYLDRFEEREDIKFGGPHVEEYDGIMYVPGNHTAYSPTYEIGDLNQDGAINASDAAKILIASAKLGAASSSELNVGQEYAADVNGDGVINASDAALVLIYAAKVGAGETGELYSPSTT